MKTTKILRNLVLPILVLAFTLGSLLGAPTAHAATTTTKYLNGRILFSSDRDGGDYDIFSMNPDGTNIINLTPNSPGIDQAPSMSPDGTKIVYWHSSNTDTLGLYIMDVDGSNPTRLNTIPTDHSYVLFPRWSPTSDLVAYVLTNEDNATARLYTIHADGIGQTLIRSDVLAYSTINWTYDGQRLVYTVGNFSGNDIYSSRPDGSSAIQITNDNLDKEDPAISPDGSKIIYDTNANIYIMNSDGTGSTQLTSPAPDQDFASAWAPDGSRILISNYNSTYTQGNIFSLNPDGTDRVQITTGIGVTTGPAWQPLPYTQTTNDNGTTTATIPASANYATTNYTVATNETLNLDGTLCDVTVQSGATLMGTGHACTITVNAGGTIAPGHSPGCLSSGNLSLSGTYTAQLAGTTACSGYDQLQVTGTVTVGGTLNTSVLNGFIPKAGDVFTLITNDGTDPVTGTFTNLPEGATLTINGSVFKISYTGGDGNDVTLTTQTIPGTPNTGTGLMQASLWPTVMVTLSSVALFITIRRPLWAGKQQR